MVLLRCSEGEGASLCLFLLLRQVLLGLHWPETVTQTGRELMVVLPLSP